MIYPKKNHPKTTPKNKTKTKNMSSTSLSSSIALYKKSHGTGPGECTRNEMSTSHCDILLYMKTKTTKKNKKLFLGDDKEQKISTLAMVISLVVVVKGVFICFALMAVCYRYILLPNLINVKPICCVTMFIVFMIFLSLFLFTILLYSLQHVCSLTTHAPKWNNKRRGEATGPVV